MDGAVTDLICFQPSPGTREKIAAWAKSNVPGNPTLSETIRILLEKGMEAGGK